MVRSALDASFLSVTGGKGWMETVLGWPLLNPNNQIRVLLLPLPNANPSSVRDRCSHGGRR